MNMFVVSLLFMAAFALQYFLTFLQMRNFSKFYGEYRRAGYKAAIGKFSGVFHAGSIVMFGIDEDGVIHQGTVMQGVTVFARFKDFDLLNGKNIVDLTPEFCQKLGVSYSIKKALIDANHTYHMVMRGEEIPVPPSPFQRLGGLLRNSVLGLRNALSNTFKI